MAKNYGLIVHPEDFDEILLRMTNEEAGVLFKCMIKTFKGEEIDAPNDRYLGFCVSKICGRVEREVNVSKSRSEAGSKGGAPVGNDNANKQKTSKKQANDKQKTSKIQAKTSSNNTNITNITNITNKRLYGVLNNVLLSDEEYNKIVDAGLSGLIDELSTYIDSKGAKYKSHYATILSWGRRREKEKPRGESKAFKGDMSTRDYNFDELEKRLIKN